MYTEIHKRCEENNATLIAVSKTKPIDQILTIYEKGQRDFGENRVQELVEKYQKMPKDIKWHLIGHLQKNKVKHIASFVHMIHSVESEALLQTISKEAAKNNRSIDILLQIKIAQEDTKYGLDIHEAQNILEGYTKGRYPSVSIKGFMGMATFTNDQEQIRKEFNTLSNYSSELAKKCAIDGTELSMGMSGDYQIALEEGSTMIRVGSLIFGNR